MNTAIDPPTKIIRLDPATYRIGNARVRSEYPASKDTLKEKGAAVHGLEGKGAIFDGAFRPESDECNGGRQSDAECGKTQRSGSRPCDSNTKNEDPATDAFKTTFLMSGLQYDFRVHSVDLQSSHLFIHFWSIDAALSFYSQHFALAEMRFVATANGSCIPRPTDRYRSHEHREKALSVLDRTWATCTPETHSLTTLSTPCTKRQEQEVPDYSKVATESASRKSTDRTHTNVYCPNTNCEYFPSRITEPVINKLHPTSGEETQSNKAVDSPKRTCIWEAGSIDQQHIAHARSPTHGPVTFLESTETANKLPTPGCHKASNCRTSGTQHRTRSPVQSYETDPGIDLLSQSEKFSKRIGYFNRMKNFFSKNDVKKMQALCDEGRYAFLYLNSKEISCGCFSNIIMQNVVKTIGDDGLCEIIRNLGSDIAPIAATKHGAYTVQAIVLYATTPHSQALITSQFWLYGSFLISHSIGNYAIQKIVRFDEEFVLGLFLKNLEAVLEAPLGFKVLKRCLEFFRNRFVEIAAEISMIKKDKIAVQCDAIMQLIANSTENGSGSSDE